MKNNYKNLLLIIMFVFILGIAINVSAATCDGIFSGTLLKDLNDYVYTPIKWITPIALILLTSFDFAKVVFGGKKEEMDKAKNNFLKRSVAAVIIFLAPDVIKLIMSFINEQSISSCLNKFN